MVEFTYEESDFSAEWPFLRPSEEEQVEWCKENQVKSRHHDFATGEQREYNSLRANGRTLYDNLRTQYEWEHSMARDAAIREYGTKG